jgi:hypothetical protein
VVLLVIWFSLTVEWESEKKWNKFGDTVITLIIAYVIIMILFDIVIVIK